MNARRLPRQDRGFVAFVAVSVALHLAVVVLGREWKSSERHVAPVYNVQLVTSVPGGGKLAEAPVAKGASNGKALDTPAAAKNEPAHEPAAKKAVEAPPKAVATRVVPKTVAKKTAEKAVEKSAKKTKEAPAKAKPAKQESLSDALAAVKGMIKEKQRGSAEGVEGARRQEVAEFGAGGEGRQVGALAMQIYGGQIQAAIQRHWNIPGELARRNLTVQLGIRVDPSGKLLDVWIDKSSGISVFDESALRAVRATGDLPAPPQTKNGSFEIYTRFTPEGARSN